MAPHVILLPGDGIGPEIIGPAVEVLDAVAPGRFAYEEHAFGGAASGLCCINQGFGMPSVSGETFALPELNCCHALA